MIADQFDLSFERYMGQQLVHDRRLLQEAHQQLRSSWPFPPEVHQQRLDPDGSDARVRVNARSGGGSRASKLAYQTFFDFLPGRFDGLGVQVNYTYVISPGSTIPT